MNKENTQPQTQIMSLEPLTLWGDTGRIVVSVKNGYPRFTFFEKNNPNNPSGKAAFISAPTDMQTFIVLASLIRNVAESKEDVKYSIECKTKDVVTNNIMIQSVLVIARRGGDVIIGIKASHDAPVNYAKVTLSHWHNIIKDDDASTSEDISVRERAKAYSRYMMYVAQRQVETMDGEAFVRSNIPNSKRANASQAPTKKPNADEYSDVPF